MLPYYTTQNCTKCGHEFPLTDEFWHQYKNGFRKQCKICVNSSNAKRRSLNLEKYRRIEKKSRDKAKALKPKLEYKAKREPVYSEETVIIFLTKDQRTIIDITDADLATLNWTSAKTKSGYYAYRKIPGENRKTEYLHRVILERILGREMLPAPKEQVDHIDLDGLNNRRLNLRLANNTENNRNKLEYRHNTSGHRGVSWDKSRNKWASHITVNGKHIHLGRFDAFEDAIKARLDAEKEYFGEFAPKT